MSKSITDLKDNRHLPVPERSPEPIIEPVSPLKSPPTGKIDHNTKDYDLYTPDYLNPEEIKELYDFLKNESYTPEGDRGVAKYGVHYKYMGSKAKTNPLPPTLKKLMDKINMEHVDKDHQMNSCLVNRYDHNTDELPVHSDNERSIDPNSKIYTVSIGAARTIIFKKNSTGVESKLKCASGSLYTMSRKSQNFFKHRMDKEEDAEDKIRFSITFRALHWSFLNSTHLNGDSNFGKIQMGAGRRKFGSSSPGVRSFSAKIEDIDPCESASYSNVVLMVGTNDLKAPNLSNNHIRELYKKYKCKIELIRSMTHKGAKIIVCPVLPTKSFAINQQINVFNQFLYDDLSRSTLGVTVVARFRDTFLDPSTRCLRRDLSRDNLHLDEIYGVSHLVRLIKETIFSLKRSRDDMSNLSSRTYADRARGYPV